MTVPIRVLLILPQQEPPLPGELHIRMYLEDEPDALHDEYAELAHGYRDGRFYRFDMKKTIAERLHAWDVYNATHEGSPPPETQIMEDLEEIFSLIMLHESAVARDIATIVLRAQGHI